MKTISTLAIVSMVAFASLPIYAEEKKPAADPKPATETKEAEAAKIEVTGALTQEGDKIKFKDASGKVYLVTKNNTEKVTPFIGKTVKIVGKAKTKDGDNGKPFHMIVYINKIEEAAAAPKTP